MDEVAVRWIWRFALLGIGPDFQDVFLDVVALWLQRETNDHNWRKATSLRLGLLAKGLPSQEQRRRMGDHIHSCEGYKGAPFFSEVLEPEYSLTRAYFWHVQALESLIEIAWAVLGAVGDTQARAKHGSASEEAEAVGGEMTEFGGNRLAAWGVVRESASALSRLTHQVADAYEGDNLAMELAGLLFGEVKAGRWSHATGERILTGMPVFWVNGESATRYSQVQIRAMADLSLVLRSNSGAMYGRSGESRHLGVGRSFDSRSHLPKNLCAFCYFGASLKGVRAFDEDMRWSDFRRASLFGCSFVECDLEGSVFENACFEDVDFTRAKLSRCEISKCRFVRCVFAGSMSKAIRVMESQFVECDFSRVSWEEVHLSGGGLRGCQYDLESSLVLAADRKGLPLRLDLDAAWTSQGCVPNAIIERSTWPKWFAELLPLFGPATAPDLIDRSISRAHEARMGSAFSLRRVFISYSHRDKEFGEWLYDKLEFAGFDCFLDRKSMASGRIDQNVRHFLLAHRPVVLVVLSRWSAGSSWVEFEIKSAIELAESDGPRLAPVCLDRQWEMGIDRWDGPTILELRKHNVIDFGGWSSDRQHMYLGHVARLQDGMKLWFPEAKRPE